MTIKLTAEMQKIVDEKLEAGEFSTAEEVVGAALVALAEGDVAEDSRAPAISKEKLDELIREGMATPSSVITKEDFAAMRRDLIRQYGPGQP